VVVRGLWRGFGGLVSLPDGTSQPGQWAAVGLYSDWAQQRRFRSPLWRTQPGLEGETLTNPTPRRHTLHRQGCSRLHSWDDLEDPEVRKELRTKIMVKGRVPRTKDFQMCFREDWGTSAHRKMIESAQKRILASMPALGSLLPIKMSLAELTPRCVINIAPIVVAQFLDGRSGMSYGFLAYQLPTGPVEKCDKVTVLVTRSGCDKQNPHPQDDWILLSFDPERISLEMSRALGDITSPSFDSWLILSQAATNLALARRFKAAGRSARYVDLVENKGVAVAHFHGFVQRDALPPNVAFFGQDRLPLPCGSVESALLTIEEKGAIADKVLALEEDIDYAGAWVEGGVLVGACEEREGGGERKRLQRRRRRKQRR